MPGIQLLQKKNSNISVSLEQLENIAYNTDYHQSKLFENDSFIVYNSSYEDYPIIKFLINDIVIILEGYVYNINHEKIINNIAEIYKNKNIFNTDIIANEFEGIDGDYIIYIINPIINELVIINDQLKRLPLYYFENENCFICARDLKFITSNMELEINKDALIDYLLFMIPSGDDTLHKNVYKLDCATILKSTRNELTIRNYKIWNYQEQNRKKNSFQKNHQELTNLLLTGMKNLVSKIEGNDINVLLSGGLDSRTIIAMLNKLDKNVHTQTFLLPDKANLDDYEKSKKIASLVGFDWNGYDVEEINIENIHKIINLKDAMNYAGIANILSFLKRITKKNEQYYTGDWGRLFKDEFPKKKINSNSELINYIVCNRVVFKPEVIAEILNIPKQKVLNRINNIFSKYPETDYNFQYMHFLYHERTFNWCQEGEDRNRKYFWFATPFSNQILYDYVNNINPKHKQSFRLYKQILNNIDKSFLDIPYGDSDILNSNKYKITDKMKRILASIPLIWDWLSKHSKKEISYFENGDKFIKLFLSSKNQELFNVNLSRNYTKAELYTLISLLEYFKL